MPGEWRLFESRPGKNIYSRIVGDEVEFLEEFIEDPFLEAARQQRDQIDLDGYHKDFQPMAVIPDSVRSRAINEGWADDKAAWKRWMNDLDNRYLRVKGGTV